MTHLYTDLSGEGDVPMTDASFPGLFRVKVTSLGMAHPVGSSASVLRFVDIGWIAPFESAVPPEQDGPDVCFYSPQFIEYQFQSFDWTEFVQHIAGIDGLHYALKTGVVVDIVVV
jgi:hypothetical protein